MKNYEVRFKVQSGVYQNVIGDYIEATSPAEALTLARHWLVDNGMDPIEALELSADNLVLEEGDEFGWTY